MGRLKTLLNNIANVETELRSLYKQLEQEKDDMFNAIVETAPNFIAVIQDEKFVFVNSTVLQLLQCSLSDIIGKSVFEKLHPDFYNVIKERLSNLNNEKLNPPIQVKFIKPNGEYVDIEASSTPFSYNNLPAGLIAGRDITNELQQKEKLEDEKNLRELVLNSFPELIAFYEPNHKIRWMNDSSKKVYGITDDSYVGKNCYNIRFGSNKPCTDCPIYSNKTETNERIVHDKDIIWNVRHSSIVNSQGTVTGYIELSTDITQKEKRKAELQKAEQMLRESEQRFREIFENSRDGICLLEVIDDSHLRLLDVNPQFEKEMDIDREKQLGQVIDKNTTSVIGAFVNIKYERCVNTGVLIEETVEINQPQGLRTFNLVVAPIRNNSGKVYRIVGIIRDITDEIKAKRDLETSRKGLLKAELVASLGHFEYDTASGIDYWSDGAYEIFNAPPELRHPSRNAFHELIHPDDRERINNARDKAIKELGVLDEICRIIDLKGNEKIIRGIGQVQVDKNGKPSTFFGTIQDITLIHNLNSQLYAEEEKFKILAESSPVGIYLRIDEKPAYANQTMLKMAGINSLETLSNIDIIALAHPEDKIKAQLLIQKIKNTNTGAFTRKQTLRKLNENCTINYYDFHVTRFKINNANYLQIIVIDNTEEYENERIRQRLAASSLYLEQKTKFANDIESTLKNILSSGQKIERTDFQPVINILKSFSLADKDWELVNNHIENIHPEFVSNLKKKCPTLSVNDIKHCACIRLNLDTKEIARFFNVKPSSIQTSRVRLKKKFGLPDTTDLREFILGI